ncbi:hypothetical protein [Mucilaginibacter gilvus]|uniref:hypothetical protein n=1 Tax=Mucilaginibacter gilvus TaxID=2305909 RepID=UPI0014191C52|nr:hypothetical protein [Mucilaginibacter gilvus]
MQRKTIVVNSGAFQTTIPCWKYGSMKNGDLELVHAYLQIVKQVSNTFVKFENKPLAK